MSKAYLKTFNRQTSERNGKIHFSVSERVLPESFAYRQRGSEGFQTCSRRTCILSLLAGSILCAPLFLFAQTTQGGFPNQSVWLSKSNAVARETIQIYAALYNAGAKTFSGTLVFLIDNERIAEKEFSLDVGASVLESALWKSAEGAHTVRASIENASGVPMESITESSSAIAFAIAKPPASLAASSVSEAASAVSDVFATVVPYAEATVQTVHGAIEPYRESIVAYLENVQAKADEGGSANRKETSDFTETKGDGDTVNATGTVETLKNAWSTLSQVALAGALYAAETPALFYALLLAVIVGTLYGLFRWALRRPF
ncbi:hypothetical protein A2673_00030 [Candidatus Kaiserbacteria bacterium RIFCSPHIGHO2_01_FULL_50_13]|uniref:CARDB domain-containing protein n=1 Tax=Candidatus Kaiserbacteria bacterium RIFCSPLOWO2_01_FULL_50_24 TaxID=1798507 RepID=A0A1F6EQZ2_9BACT|nr:MAG: hypothetical protein A2673_00030 [Candidatus Kaiserbacteria bacterium RIFCSPHIGHO2_01_FULL_50_13]OGG76047.1 MAG: hypothetical protein A3A34_00670 [Candidatus Kaiserbacteria bacterium RIFCSPLOWO2_01_FULL_50_24]OGG81342.1 MAG: hypothetical protein A3H74_02215 [Candidatus Kaiserbacteria bacterium RIFCSPLOWO2_02_FULL_51_13]